MKASPSRNRFSERQQRSPLRYDTWIIISHLAVRKGDDLTERIEVPVVAPVQPKQTPPVDFVRSYAVGGCKILDYGERLNTLRDKAAY